MTTTGCAAGASASTAIAEARRVFDAAQRDVERLAANGSDERAVNHGDPLQG